VVTVVADLKGIYCVGDAIANLVKVLEAAIEKGLETNEINKADLDTPIGRLSLLVEKLLKSGVDSKLKGAVLDLVGYILVHNLEAEGKADFDRIKELLENIIKAKPESTRYVYHFTKYSTER
jgi:predicted RNase H-like HicB family nuclease